MQPVNKALASSTRPFHTGLTQLAQRDRYFIVFMYYIKWLTHRPLLKLVTVIGCVKYSLNHEK
nr:hypothetical protein [Nostoc sp. DedQUE02]